MEISKVEVKKVQGPLPRPAQGAAMQTGRQRSPTTPPA